MKLTPDTDKKICPVCGKAFVPYTTGQIFCSKVCGKTATHTMERNSLVVGKELDQRKAKKEKASGEKLLSIAAAARFLNVSRPTIYSCIESGVLSPVPFSERSVRIPMSQLVLLQDDSPVLDKADLGLTISKEDALKRYSISETWLYRKTKTHGVPSVVVKGKAYFQKDALDRLFPPRSAYDRRKWFTIDDLVQAQGMSDKRILTIVSEHNIETSRVRQLLLISKEGWKKARVLLSKLERYYMTTEQACKEYRIGPVKFREIIGAAGLQGVQNGHFKYYKKAELEPLLRDRSPKIPKEITKNYIRCKDALKKYHIGLQRFLDETKANNVEKIRTAGNFVWYKKSELDKLFKKL